MQTMGIIEANRICKSYLNSKEKVRVLENIRLQMKKGSFNIIMGPSGSGKTTLLNIIGALDLPDSGSVILDGMDITAVSDYSRDSIRRQKIGFVFQSVALMSNMSAFENVDYSLRINGYDRRDRKKRAEECLDYVNLKKRMKHRPQELSGGEQQRVAIARAIAHKPLILLADEPTAELDTNTGLYVVKLFRDLAVNENMTIVMCTHDTNMIQLADNIFMLEDGVLADAG